MKRKITLILSVIADVAVAESLELDAGNVATMQDFLFQVSPFFRSPETEMEGFAQIACKQCGCTDDDCSQCIAASGEPCYWVEPELCSRCAAETETWRQAKLSAEPPDMYELP